MTIIGIVYGSTMAMLAILGRGEGCGVVRRLIVAVEAVGRILN